MNKNTQSKTKKIALLGMLFALAMVLSFVEGIITPLLGLPPGVKPGLANIVVMYAVLFLGRKYALCLVFLKSFFGFLTRGAIAALLSCAGGLLSLLVLCILLSLKAKPSMFICSVSSAVCHNIGQLLALSLVVSGSPYTIYYMPVLLISGVIMGAVTAVTLNAIIPALSRLNFTNKF